MNFNEIFLFKLKLDLGLMEIKAIQDWADAKILNDHNDQIALNICYSKNDSEILNYINHLIITSEEKNQDQLKSVVALFILKEYFQNYLPKILDNQLDIHISKLRYLAFIADNLKEQKSEASLESYLIAYYDEITLTIEGNIGMMSPQIVYNQLYQYLDDWIEENNDKNR